MIFGILSRKDRNIQRNTNTEIERGGGERERAIYRTQSFVVSAQ